MQRFEKRHANATLFIGIAIGIGVGMYMFALFAYQGAEPYMRSNHNRMMGDARYFVVTGGTMPMATSFSTERGYLVAMIAHHEDAVKMSHKLLSLTGVSEDIRNFAEDVITVQSAEIQIMKKWLSDIPTHN